MFSERDKVVRNPELTLSAAFLRHGLCEFRRDISRQGASFITFTIAITTIEHGITTLTTASSSSTPQTTPEEAWTSPGGHR